VWVGNANQAFFISNLDHKSAWCTLYCEQTLKTT
jgi:hypothetical protein